MQRAAASNSSAPPQIQSQEAEAPHLKRQKTSKNPIAPTTPASDSRSIQSAIDEDELKRERAIDRLGEDAGETKWVLNTADVYSNRVEPNLRIATASYSEIDEGSWKSAMTGRQSFGKFNQEIEVQWSGFLLFLDCSLNQS